MCNKALSAFTTCRTKEGDLICQDCFDLVQWRQIYTDSLNSQIPDDEPQIRTFDSGATRDALTGKLAVHRFMSPKVVKRYCEYLESHRVQTNGEVRDPDNWKKGMPKEVYAESLFRHVMIDAWEQFESTGTITEDTLCAILFNASGFLFEGLREK